MPSAAFITLGCKVNQNETQRILESFESAAHFTGNVIDRSGFPLSTENRKLMSDCIFCKFVRKEIPTDVVYETDSVLAVRDINPQAPTHVLIVPKKHVEGLHTATADDDLQELLLAAAEIARQQGIDRAGYRVVINSGQAAGQSVWHLHVHLLGGRTMAWPPG